MNKTSHIVIENYKEEEFRKALNKSFFTNFKIKPYDRVEGCCIILIKHSSKRTYDLKNLCNETNKKFNENK